MKRWLVVLLVLLAVVVLISPGIVGRLAERNIERSLGWADRESDEIAITEKTFDRAWFTSEGRYRIEFTDGALQSTVADLLGLDDNQPVALIVDTHIDHGLIPVTSLSRESGSLRPGLASAVSTMQLDTGGDELIPIPGKLYSQLGLSGQTASRFVLQSGSTEFNGTQAKWGDADIAFTTSASGRALQYEFAMEIASLQATAPGGSIRFGNLTLESDSAIEGGRVNGNLAVRLADFSGRRAGEFDMALNVAVQGLDAASLQAIVAAIEAAEVSDEPDRALADAYPLIANDLKTLLAAGMEIRVEQFDVMLPQGPITSEFSISLPESDATQDFSWMPAILTLTASAEVRIPATLVDMARAANPRAGALVAMGFLEKVGEFYVMDARYAQGLLTVNGAPMPIPLPAR